MKRKAFTALVVFLLLPIALTLVFEREVAGSMTILTIRGTTIRTYYSNSGNLAFGRRSNIDRLNPPEWMITRNDKVAWHTINVFALLLGYPFLIIDVLRNRT